MKLYELLDVVDYNRESETQKIQVCQFDGDWDVFDECLTSSFLLLPFYTANIAEIEAVDVDTIRVDIDWEELDSRLHFFKWNKERDNNESMVEGKQR